MSSLDRIDRNISTFDLLFAMKRFFFLVSVGSNYFASGGVVTRAIKMSKVGVWSRKKYVCWLEYNLFFRASSGVIFLGFVRCFLPDDAPIKWMVETIWSWEFRKNDSRLWVGIQITRNISYLCVYGENHRSRRQLYFIIILLAQWRTLPFSPVMAWHFFIILGFKYKWCNYKKNTISPRQAARILLLNIFLINAELIFGCLSFCRV